MIAIITLAAGEIRLACRNRWVLAATSLLAALALTLALLGSAPTGTVGVAPLDVTVVSLSSLTTFLVPLIALLLAYDAIVGEAENGTLLLLLAYPIARWQVVGGKFLGHTLVLALATVLGYGTAVVAVAWTGGMPDAASLRAFAAMVGSSVLLGAAFLALGYAISAAVRDRGTAAGLAVAAWLGLVLVWDMALLGVLVADRDRVMPAALVHALLLLNPADVYRLFNLSGRAAAGMVPGVGGLSAQAPFGGSLLLAVLTGWIAAPLTLAALVFHRRSV